MRIVDLALIQARRLMRGRDRFWSVLGLAMAAGGFALAVIIICSGLLRADP